MENTSNRVCTDCGWKAFATARCCPVCGGPLQASTRLAAASPQESGTHTYSLTTLFLILTLICVSLGAIVTAPGLGIPFVVLSVPALIRTWAASPQSPLSDSSWTVRRRIGKFLNSIGVMFLIAIAGIIAFQLACWTSCFGVAALTGEKGFETALWTGITIGSAAGLFLMGYLIRRSWPRRSS